MVKRLRPRACSRTPRVSVVIPCYNYGRYLPDVVGDVLAQPGVEVEVLIVDDCSPDGSAEVAERLAAADPRVEAILHRTNQGHIATYNDGLARVSGEYVVLLSADDLLTPGSLGRSVALMEARPEVALTYGFVPEFADSPPPARTRVSSWTVWPGQQWLDRLCRRGSNVVQGPEAVLRRTVMDELVGYDPRLPHSGDMHLWMRAALRGAVGRVNGAAQAYYRVHGQNMHLNDFAGILTDLLERRRAFDLLYEDPVTSEAEAARLARAGRLGLARDALRFASQLHDRGSSGTDRSSDPAAYAEFAVETAPDIVGSRQWRAYQARARRGIHPWRRAASTQLQDVRAALLWRRWRRFGV